jgi:hypothetical protein
MGDGFLKFRWAPFLLAVVTLVGFHFWAAHLVRVSADYFVDKPADLRGWQSKTFAQEQSQHGPTAYFLGGSGMMWSIPAEADFRGSNDSSVRLRNYAYGFQTIVESYVLLKKLPLHQGDVVFLHVSPSRVNRTLLEENLVCRPYFYTVEAADILAVYDELDYESGVNPLCRVSFLARGGVLKNVLAKRLRGKRPVRFVSHIPQPFEGDLDKLEEKRSSGRRAQYWSAREAFRGRWLEMEDRQVESTLRALSRIRNHLEQRGVRLILVDLPLNRRWFDEYFDWDQTKERTYERLGVELRRQGYEYHDWRWRSEFGYADFYDHQHMVQSGRDKIFPLYQRTLTGRE